jgi:hypothetical protein
MELEGPLSCSQKTAKNSVPTSKKTHYVSVTKPKRTDVISQLKSFCQLAVFKNWVTAQKHRTDDCRSTYERKYRIMMATARKVP